MGFAYAPFKDKYGNEDFNVNANTSSTQGLQMVREKREAVAAAEEDEEPANRKRVKSDE